MSRKNPNRNGVGRGGKGHTRKTYHKPCPVQLDTNAPMMRLCLGGVEGKEDHFFFSTHPANRFCPRCRDRIDAQSQSFGRPRCSTASAPMEG